VTEHLTDEQIRAYGSRALAPVDLLHVSGHLSACARCRTRAASPESLRREMAAVRASLDDETVHVPYEELEAYVGGSTSAELTARIDQHAVDCDLCAASLHDLEHLRDELARSARTASASSGIAGAAGPATVLPHRRGGLRRLLATPPFGLTAAAALVLAVLAGALVRQLDRERADTAQRERVLTEQRQLAEAEAASLRQALDQRTPEQPTATPPVAASRPALLSFVVVPGILRDGSEQTLMIDRQAVAVQLRLQTDTDVTADRFQVTIADANGSTVWATTMARRALFASGPDHADVLIPAAMLQDGRHRLTLATADGEVIDDYGFTVAR
jgi:hypothetical protein